MDHISNHLPTKELQALDAAHHMHPFSDSKDLKEKGVRPIVRAEGVWIHDSDGNRIIDAMSGLWCVNIGYGRKELADIAARQMLELPYYNSFFKTTTPPAVALASKLAQFTPAGLNHVFFCGSGSEANDTNIRLARHYHTIRGKPEKTIIISRENAYHGSTVAAASLGGMKGMHAQGGLPIPDIVHIEQPYWYGEGGGMAPDEFGMARAKQLEETIERLGENKIAAFIAEPIQGAGGVIIPPDSYWPEIQRICNKYDILLIVDEVITGFGRTGKKFGADYYNLKPDLMTLAKGLSSGYLPIGGVMVSDAVFEVFYEKGGEFAHGYTYSGHPVCCAVALENLRIIEEEQIIERGEKEIIPVLKEAWLSLADHPLVGEVRIKGFMGGLEISPDKTNPGSFFAEKGRAGILCRDQCFRNNLVMRAVGDSMVICPPLVISHAEIEELVVRARKSLDGTHKILKEEGLMS